MSINEYLENGVTYTIAPIEGTITLTPLDIEGNVIGQVISFNKQKNFVAISDYYNIEGGQYTITLAAERGAGLIGDEVDLSNIEQNVNIAGDLTVTGAVVSGTKVDTSQITASTGDFNTVNAVNINASGTVSGHFGDFTNITGTSVDVDTITTNEIAVFNTASIRDIASDYIHTNNLDVSNLETDSIVTDSIQTTEINGVNDSEDEGFVLKSGSSENEGEYSTIELTPTGISVSTIDFKVNGSNVFYDSNELDIVDLNANNAVISIDSIGTTDLRFIPILKLKLNTLEGVTDATYDLSALKFTQIPNVAATREIWLDTTNCDVTTNVDGTETTLTPTIVFPSNWKWLEYGALTSEVPTSFVSGRVYHIVVRSEGFKDTVDGEEVWGPIVANLAYYYDSTTIGE